jgi:hypothetical protein
MANQAASFQVAGSSSGYSTYSYDQTPGETPANQEIFPTIIHSPIAEASTSEDFHITATIQNLGLGVPVAHYRFGNSKKYSKNVMKPIRPDEYDFRILAAALNDKKIEYYIEVVDGSRTLATYGTSTQPVTVGLNSPGHGWFYLIVISSLIGVFLVSKVIISSKKQISSDAEIARLPLKSAKRVSKLARTRQ